MNTPRINPNDPKWTAYVLGELDEADRASVERLLEASAEARALVNELKASASALDDALASESPDLLTAAQRAAVSDAADASRARWFAHATPQLLTRWRWGLGAAAAAIIVAAVVPMHRDQRTPAVRAGGSVPTERGVTTPRPSSQIVGLQPIDRQVTSATGKSPEASANPPAVAAAPTLTFDQAQAPNGGLAAISVSGALGESEIGSPTINVIPEAPAVDVQNSRLQQLTPVPQGQLGQIGQQRGAGGRGGGGGSGSAANQGRVITGIGGGVYEVPSAPAAAPPPPSFSGAVDAVSRSDGSFPGTPRPTGAESYARVAEN